MSNFTALEDYSVDRHYILIHPMKINDIVRADSAYDNNDFWKVKARRLQTRRWREIKDQHGL